MPIDEDRNKRIADYLQAPWLRKRLAKVMAWPIDKPGGPSLPPLTWTERKVATAYVVTNRTLDKINRRWSSWVLRTFIGIDNRSNERIRKEYERSQARQKWFRSLWP